MSGYAVVDVETTGLFPGNHRIVEIAVVQVSPAGDIESSWATLVNPGRDLGPQSVHGITCADILFAPTFDQVAGTLAALLAGRVFVAHNEAFDRRFVQHAFGVLGYDVPLLPGNSLCTMRLAREFLSGAPRSLAGCCEVAGIVLEDAHEALADATATAGLLRHYLRECGDVPRWPEPLELAAASLWPVVPAVACECARRGIAIRREVPFLSRLVDHLPHPASTWEQEQYLALLDRALLDRILSVREREGLVACAHELGIDQHTALDLHLGYLRALACAAWDDGSLTDAERHDLTEVARLLDLSQDDADYALQHGESDARALIPAPAQARAARFQLRPGDIVVFTGDMAVPRDEWCTRATSAGLDPRSAVTKKAALLVAADPDSLSGKASKAAAYGIPIVTEDAFARLLGDCIVRSARPC